MANLARIEDLFMSRLEKFQPLSALQEAIVKNTDEILELSAKQLDEGEDATGQNLGVYSNWYAAYKGRHEPIDLKNTGAFREARYLIIDAEKTEINSRDWKNATLRAYVKRRTGGEPLGVKKQNIPLMVAAIRPDIIQQFRQSIGVR
jgi:hypothetical protein